MAEETPDQRPQDQGPGGAHEGRSDRDGPRSDGPRSEGFRSDGPRGGRGRDRDDDRPRGLKARLRAKARKKARKAGRRAFRGKKVSRLTTDRTLEVDYKDARVLRMFLTETGKIIPRRISGNTAKQQREIVQAVKRARHLAILPYADITQ
jgi:small subunit ribosomal protein S18